MWETLFSIFHKQLASFFIHLLLGFLPAPFAFFQMQIKMTLDPIEFSQSSFNKRSERFDAIDMYALARFKSFILLVNPVMFIITYVY